MEVIFNINSFPIEDQFRIYGYLKNKFEVNKIQREFANIAIKDMEEFPSKLKFTLLRNGVVDISSLLQLNRQDLINMSGIGLKSREIIERFCESYKSNRIKEDTTEFHS